MVTKILTRESPVRDWVLVGPLFAIFAFVIALFKFSSTQMEIPLAGILALVLCWRWKLLGLSIAIPLIAASVGWRYAYADEFSHQWDLTLAGAFVLSSFITALSSMEAESILGTSRVMESESLQQLQSLQRDLAAAEKKLQDRESFFSLKEKDFLAKISQQQSEYEEAQFALGIARGEIINSDHQKERLHRELLDQQQLTLKFQESFDEATIRLKEKTKQAEAAANIPLLERELAFKCQDLADWQAKAQELREQLTQQTHQYAIQQALYQEMRDQSDALLNEKRMLEGSLHCLQTELEELQRLQQTPKTKDTQDYRRLEGLYNQLRDQFEEKSSLLDETRRQLFHANEELSAMKLSEQETAYQEPLVPLTEVENCLKLAEERFKKEQEDDRKEIAELQSLVQSILQ